MNTHHQAILKILQALPRRKNRDQFTSKYSGSMREAYGVITPDLRALAKDWLGSHATLSPTEVLETIDAVMGGASHEEKKLASYMLGLRKDVRALVPMEDLDRWLSDLEGWAEVDCLCQNIFQAQEMLERWSEWEPFLDKLSRDEVIEKRRASIVFLVMPVRKSEDARLHECALRNIDRLKHEKDILITKAISWVLRFMTVSDKPRVAAYLDTNAESLPKIAVRETRKVLLTGKKT